MFPKIKTALTNLVVKEDISNAAKIFGESFIIKILNTYYPEKYFPINGRSSLVNLMKIFDEPYKTISTLDLNQAIQSIFNNYKDKYPSSITSLDFMLFLYKHFNLKDDGAVTTISQSDNVFRKPSIIQFHPSYTYEDFIRGIISKVSEKGIEYKVENKILAELAYEALENPFANYVLIIDEINRANLSSVLGELIYALEYRGEAVESMYEVDGENKLILPQNLYIIGTMNTADRSVGHIDYAIRRRFAFVDVLPKDLTSELQDKFMLDKFNQVASLFVKDYDSELDYNDDSISIERSEHLTHDFDPKDVWLGHSYFIKQYEKDVNGDEIEENPIDFNLRIKYEIKPILEEYIKDGILKETAREVINTL